MENQETKSTEENNQKETKSTKENKQKKKQEAAETKSLEKESTFKICDSYCFVAISLTLLIILVVYINNNEEPPDICETLLRGDQFSFFKVGDDYKYSNRDNKARSVKDIVKEFKTLIQCIEDELNKTSNTEIQTDKEYVKQFSRLLFHGVKTNQTVLVRTKRHGRAPLYHVNGILTASGIGGGGESNGIGGGGGGMGNDRNDRIVGVSIPESDFLSHRQQFGEHCVCWNSSDGLIREVECSCTHLPSRSFVIRDVHRLTIENSETYKTLSNEDIRPYASQLKELILTELPYFQDIQNQTFLGMPNLATIYIYGTPSLTQIPHGVFNGYIPKLKNIKIVHTGLQVTPVFNQLYTQHHLDTVELENNKITQIEPNWVENLKVEHLNLNYNKLRTIGPSAFAGATIARLTLKGNKHLTSLHPDAFANIESLRQLDLSETSINYLPTHGLKYLDVLKLEKVFTLTVIPSIHHFENLQEAVMTFPYHCCAFSNPETHDPVEFKRFQEFVNKVEAEKCHPTTTTPPSAEADAQIPQSALVQRRRKRTINNLPDKASPTQLSSSHLRHYNGQKRRSVDSSPENMSTNDQQIRRKDGEEEEDDSSLPLQQRLVSDINETHGNPNSFGVLGSGSRSHGKINDMNDFDPFVFDPDRAFGNQIELSEFEDSKRTSENDGSWESVGEHTQEEINTDFGMFHTGIVPISPPVIALCGNVAVKKVPVVKCSPLPDAFSPCEDIMGNNWLRVAVWFVVLFSLLGNITVLVVLFLTINRVNVQRLLIANLAWSDCCMAIYLFMVAAEDLLSLGSYFNYAIDWQLGWGCQIAGFLTVFASELSVFTLTVITGERWYALTRAIHLTKRLTIEGAAKLMTVGWILALILATLPLIGVSSYSKTSICLPMEANTIPAQAYLVFLLLFNGLAFILVSVAYLKMYKAVAGHNNTAPAHTADLAIAKKMALLVFTNFACWAPVAFFGLTAVSGRPLIGVTEAKILLVFFYPLNSILNPYLYAILTKQFRKDFLTMLSRHGLCTDCTTKHRDGPQSTNNTVQTMQTIVRLGSGSEQRTSGRASISHANEQLNNSSGHGHQSPLTSKSLIGSPNNRHDGHSIKFNLIPSSPVKTYFHDSSLPSPSRSSLKGKKEKFNHNHEQSHTDDLEDPDGISAETCFISGLNGKNNQHHCHHNRKNDSRPPIYVIC